MMDRNITQPFWTNSKKKWSTKQQEENSTEFKFSELKFKHNNVNIILTYYSHDGIFHVNVNSKNYVSTSMSHPANYIIILSSLFGFILRHWLENKHSVSVSEI